MYRCDRFDLKKDFIYGEIPWARIIGEPPIVINKNGSLQVTFKYHGPDLDSSTRESLAVISNQLNSSFCIFDGDWALWAEAQRLPSVSYATDVYFPDPVTKAIDDQRKKLFSSGTYFESSYYLTLLWLPPSDSQEKLRSMVIEGLSEELTPLDEHIASFNNMVEKIYSSFKAQDIPIDQLNTEEMLTYLHSTVSSKKHTVKLPYRYPVMLDSFLPDESIVGGLLPRIGEYHISVISPLAYPSASLFGFFDSLNRLNFSYRWVTRFFFMDKAASLSELESYRRNWHNKIKSFFTRMGEMFTGRENNSKLNENAITKEYEVKDALLEVEQDKILYGFYSTEIILMNKDQKQLDAQAKFMEQRLSELGVKCKTEDLNSLSAWFAGIPGNVNHQLRRPMISTANLVHLMPISDIWAGQKRNKFLNGPALLYARAVGNTPFRLTLHIEDLGHTMLIGPTGAGKSVHLNLISSQFRKYKDAQIFIFDKDASSQIITEAVGGKFYDIAGGEKVMAFQPLALIDDEREAAWALDWLTDFIKAENFTVTPEVTKMIWNALLSMKGLPQHQKTITTLIASVQNREIRDALSPLAAGGKYGNIFDAEHDELSFGSWQSFEMGALMNIREALTPVLMYLFHRIEQQLSGKPTIIVLDECWVFFDNPIFAGKIREWLKVLRKAKASVIFATQTLADMENSPILPTIRESCKSKIFLPNSNALEKSTYPLYESFGLNARQINIIANATPKQDYYYVSPLGCRLYSLALSPYELMYFSVTKDDRVNANKIIDKYGHEDFYVHWEEFKNTGTY